MDDTVRRSHAECLKSGFKQERRELRKGDVRNYTKDQKKQQEKHRQWLRWTVLFFTLLPQMQHIDKAVNRLSLGPTHSHTTCLKEPRLTDTLLCCPYHRLCFLSAHSLSFCCWLSLLWRWLVHLHERQTMISTSLQHFVLTWFWPCYSDCYCC